MYSDSFLSGLWVVARASESRISRPFFVFLLFLLAHLLRRRRRLRCLGFAVAFVALLLRAHSLRGFWNDRFASQTRDRDGRKTARERNISNLEGARAWSRKKSSRSSIINLVINSSAFCVNCFDFFSVKSIKLKWKFIELPSVCVCVKSCDNAYQLHMIECLSRALPLFWYWFIMKFVCTKKEQFKHNFQLNKVL